MDTHTETQAPVDIAALLANMQANIQAQMTQQTTQMTDHVTGQINTVHTLITGVQGQIAGIQQDVVTQGKRIDGMEVRIARVLEPNMGLSNRIRLLKQDTQERITNLNDLVLKESDLRNTQIVESHDELMKSIDLKAKTVETFVIEEMTAAKETIDDLVEKQRVDFNRRMVHRAHEDDDMIKRFDDIQPAVREARRVSEEAQRSITEMKKSLDVVQKQQRTDVTYFTSQLEEARDTCCMEIESTGNVLRCEIKDNEKRMNIHQAKMNKRVSEIAGGLNILTADVDELRQGIVLEGGNTAIPITTETSKFLERRVEELGARLTREFEHKFNEGIGTSTPIPNNSTVRIINVGESSKIPTFAGTPQEGPIKYLRQIIGYFKTNNIPEHRQLDILDSSFKNNANTWWNVYKSRVANFEEFVCCFRENFWNQNLQREIKLNIHHNDFDRNKGDMSHYFLKRVAQNEELDNPMTDHELIQIVTNHFSTDVQTILMARNVQDITGMDLILKQLDAKKMRVKRNDAHQSEQRQDTEKARRKEVESETRWMQRGRPRSTDRQYTEQRHRSTGRNMFQQPIQRNWPPRNERPFNNYGNGGNFNPYPRGGPPHNQHFNQQRRPPYNNGDQRRSFEAPPNNQGGGGPHRGRRNTNQPPRQDGGRQVSSHMVQCQEDNRSDFQSTSIAVEKLSKPSLQIQKSQHQTRSLDRERCQVPRSRSQI